MDAFFGNVLNWEHKNGTSSCTLCNKKFIVTYDYVHEVFCLANGTGVFDNLIDLEIAIIKNFSSDQIKSEIEKLKDVLQILEFGS